MATTRRRSTGFDSASEKEEIDLAYLEDFSEPTSEIHEEPKEVVNPIAFVEEVIAPLADLGPRFVEEVVEPLAEPKKTAEVKTTPKRHPRNIPRFSRTR